MSGQATSTAPTPEMTLDQFGTGAAQVPHTEHLLRRDGVYLLTPDSLRAHVESGGGYFTRLRDYRYTPAQGGDGEQGKVTVTFADAEGIEIGNVGFGRFLSRDTGAVMLSATDFSDLRPNGGHEFGNGAFIHDNPTLLAQVLSTFPGRPYQG